MNLPSLATRIRSLVWSAILAFLILVVGQDVWGALLLTNLRTSPAIPWAVAVMAVILWLMWQYLNGKGWPQSTSQTRHRYFRANRVSGRAWAWGMLAGVLSIAALAGYWIVLFQLVRMPGNVLPDFSRCPMWTVVLILVMASLVSPFTEESAFRGYCQVILESNFRGPVAILISSVLFTLAHVTHGILWPKLFVYFLAGLVFGVTAYLTASILPGMAVHIIGDLTFFALVWPYDTRRKLIWETGANGWFWLHMVQAIIFTALAIVAFTGLARVSEGVRKQESQ
jgi:membrane protease YdiL (CAAX protease family)